MDCGQVSYTTTKKHFRIFCDEASKWIHIFGLYGWNIDFIHEELLPDSLATFKTDMSGRWAQIGLTPDWGQWEPTENEVRLSAFHEVMELFLTRIECLAKERFAAEREIREEIHNVIRTLENVIFFGGSNGKANYKRKEKNKNKKLRTPGKKVSDSRHQPRPECASKSSTARDTVRKSTRAASRVQKISKS